MFCQVRSFHLLGKGKLNCSVVLFSAFDKSSWSIYIFVLIKRISSCKLLKCCCLVLLWVLKVLH